ncbi:unnamed protein product [Allacma fusca]|uniref:Uncharacterized protein n=1 Tax=Allacma fusca TaxID=39272 RepID=A0A8J2P6G1_9HEXA|nr:unnamed protein product [Allacma fusca]
MVTSTLLSISTREEGFGVGGAGREDESVDEEEKLLGGGGRGEGAESFPLYYWIMCSKKVHTYISTWVYVKPKPGRRQPVKSYIRQHGGDDEKKLFPSCRSFLRSPRERSTEDRGTDRSMTKFGSRGKEDEGQKLFLVQKIRRIVSVDFLHDKLP